MDEASKIIADLRRKLDELDYKVVQYRHDMFSEFEKYTEDILRNVTQDVSSKVTKAIAVSLKDYPAINPEPQNTNQANENPKDQQSRDEQLPITSTTSNANVTQDEPPRSPHEREREFTGLFTPSYLPLLDSTDRHERRSSEDMSKTQPLKAGKTHHPDSPVMQTAIGDPSNPSTPTVVLQKPPTPLRRNTDNSTLSNGSDSDSGLRKSALRRKSSTASHSILSPRKVRFTLEGQEYSTDSTPQPPATIEEEPPKRDAIILGYYTNDSDDEEAGSEQVENIEEPPPKRISSSQALRALSRGPLENDGTKWTVVAAPPDGSASVPVDREMLKGKAYIDADDEEEENESMNTKIGTNDSEIKTSVGKLSRTEADESQLRAEDINERSASNPHPTNFAQFESSEQSKMNGMPISQSQAAVEQSSTQTSTSNAPMPVPKRKQSTFSLGDSDSESEPEEENQQHEYDADDGLFDFEEENRNTKENEKKGDISPLSPSDVISPRSLSGFKQADVNHTAMGSNMRGENSVGAHGSGMNEYGSVSRGTDQVVGTPSGIDYSYKGSMSRNHPFNQPVVSKRAQREAEQMGDMQSWVGSVDGRSGVDDRPGDSGFRSSLGMGGSLREGGQPRSFSERLALEDEMEKLKKPKK